MTIGQSSIGQRLRKIREAKKMTQQELELSIEASFGHVSRIESGHVNPSKETLMKIAVALHLSQDEALNLIGISIDPVSEQEIESAVVQTHEYFKTCTNPVYLLDDFWFVQTANDALLDFFGCPKGEARKVFVDRVRGTHALEWIFDPAQVYRPMMAREKWEQLAFDHCVYVMHRCNYDVRRDQNWLKNLLESLGRFPDFNIIWERAEGAYHNKDSHRHGYSLEFVRQGKKYSFIISNTEVVNHPRFSLVEYIPQQLA